MFYIAVYKDRRVSFPYSSLESLKRNQSHSWYKIHTVVEAPTKKELAPKVREVLKCIPRKRPVKCCFPPIICICHFR